MLKLLTIYIPTYNRSESLIKQLEAISYSDLKEYIEVIISDNCSNDVGYSKVKDFCKKENFVYKKNSLNIGADANIFNGFMESKNSKYVWILSDDDLLKNDSIGGIVNLLKDNDLDILFLTYTIKDMLSIEEWNQKTFFEQNIKISNGAGLISNVIYKKEFIKSSIPVGFQYIYTCFSHLAILIDSFKSKSAIVGCISSDRFFIPETNLEPENRTIYSKSYFGFVLLAELFEDNLKNEFINEWAKFKNLRHWFIKKRDKIASQNSIYAKAYISNYSFFFKFKLLIWYFLTPLFLVLKKYKNR